MKRRKTYRLYSFPKNIYGNYAKGRFWQVQLHKGNKLIKEFDTGNKREAIKLIRKLRKKK